MSITDWPADERPREKLLGKGPSALSDAELLAIFLRTGVTGKTAVDLARDLLNEYGDLRHYPYEVFACLFLDNRHRVIEYEELFRGTIDGASVHPREVVRRALEHNAAALILAHNHPSGVAEPSDADRSITRRLSEALALVDVRILDHFIVGEGEPLSLAERGLM